MPRTLVSPPQLALRPERPGAPAWILHEVGCARYITGFEVRSVQCLHSAPSRPCLPVGRPARVDLLLAAGWNQAAARPAREWSMQGVIGRSYASRPSAWTRWPDGTEKSEDLG
jgi:hypothetical protein